MDARFNRKGIVEKIRAISSRSDDITVSNLDAEDLLAKPDFDRSGKMLVYLDPPYVKKGPGLYKSAFDARKHLSLANLVVSSRWSWIVTYDSDPLVDRLYGPLIAGEMSIGYSAHHASMGKEKLILSPGLSAPREFLRQ